MQPLDTSLRERLADMADEARPPGFSAHSVAARVRRRRLRAMLGAAAGTTMLVAGVAVVAGRFQEGTPGARPTMPDPAALAPGGPARHAPPHPEIYRCGELLTLPNASTSRRGLAMRVDATAPTAAGAGRTDTDRGPTITVTFTSRTTVDVATTLSTSIEVLYLRDGIIVGGGPMLNLPGDDTGQGLDLVRAGFHVAPKHPSVQSVGPRDTLCPPLTWAEVWSAPQRYEVVVVQGPVKSASAGQLTLEIPQPLDAPLLVARRALGVG